MTSVAVARMELLRYLRSRDAAWTLAALAALGCIPLLPLLLLTTDEAMQFGTHPVLRQMELLRNTVIVLECVVLVTMTYLMAASTLTKEHRTGTWRLLRQSPRPAWHLHLGKGLGVLASVALGHALFVAVLLTTTPFLRRSVASVAFDGSVGLLIAACTIPGGLAEACVQKSPMRYAALRGILGLHVTALAGATAWGLAGSTRPEKVESLANLVLGSSMAPLLDALAASMRSPGSFLLAVLVSQGALAAATAWLLVRDSRS